MDKRRRLRHHRSRSRSNSSSSLFSEDSRRRSRSRDSDHQNTNNAYELYKKQKRDKQLLAEQKAANKLKGIEEIKPRKISLEDFPNFKRKLVVQNIPKGYDEEQIMNFFYQILSQTSGETYTKNPLMSVRRYDGLGFVTLEFRKRDDAEICLNLDGTECFGISNQLKILRCKRFIDQWNDQIDKGKNPAAESQRIKGHSNFSKETIFTDKNKSGDEDNRIFMGSIPFTMAEHEVKEMCEAFGRLKSFNLIKDQQNPDNNKGYCFFEYLDERAAEKAIKALNGLEIMDKKLKVQRASQGNKTMGPTMTSYKNVPEDKAIPVAKFASVPSRVVQFMNMLSKEDLFDPEEVEALKKDVLTECGSYGDILSVEIPVPEVVEGNETVAVTYAHVGAKQARYSLSGRKYNGRTVVASFYPESYFDSREFSII